MTEKSPVGDSKSNGRVERDNREVEGQVRTMASALESKLGQKIPAGSNVLPWLVLHSGTVLRQFSVAWAKMASLAELGVQPAATVATSPSLRRATMGRTQAIQ